MTSVDGRIVELQGRIKDMGGEAKYDLLRQEAGDELDDLWLVQAKSGGNTTYELPRRVIVRERAER
ncbi:MAG: hypothetical protein ACD_52C00077G0003 [uncultured bacterium]|nr:MAG: hypothetical protein ACD_52C00077G0003 [uncultured bacterium]